MDVLLKSVLRIGPWISSPGTAPCSHVWCLLETQVLPLLCQPALPAPARQLVSSGPGSGEITCGPALPNTYSAARSIPLPSHCSPPPPPDHSHHLVPILPREMLLRSRVTCPALLLQRGDHSQEEKPARSLLTGHSQASGGHKTPCASSKGSPPGMQSPLITLCPSRDTGVEPIPEGNKHHSSARSKK